MKKVLMFIMQTCPHCRNALQWMKELQAENPVYSKIEVSLIDENKQPDIANQYDYYYVPCYFIDDRKVHEGVASKEIVRQVLDQAL